MPDVEKRKEIGKQVANLYHDLKFKSCLFTIPQTEFGKQYSVLAYPIEFRPHMEKLIREYLLENSQPKIRPSEINKIL